MGIKCRTDQPADIATPKEQVLRNKRPTEVWHVDNAIQTRMKDLDHIIKRVYTTNEPTRLKSHIDEALKKYGELKHKCQDFLAERPWPDWVHKTWYGPENWQAEGTVGGVLNKLHYELECPKPDEKKIRQYQSELRTYTILKADNKADFGMDPGEMIK